MARSLNWARVGMKGVLGHRAVFCLWYKGIPGYDTIIGLQCMYLLPVNVLIWLLYPEHVTCARRVWTLANYVYILTCLLAINVLNDQPTNECQSQANSSLADRALTE